MRYKPGVDPNQLSFELKVEQLGVAVMEKNKAELERLKQSIGEIMDYLPFTIKEVKEKERIINEVQKSAFWRNVTYEDAQMLLEELAPLMKYKRTERRPPSGPPRRLTGRGEGSSPPPPEGPKRPRMLSCSS
jgi:type I site-specific restriction endonuclease